MRRAANRCRDRRGEDFSTCSEAALRWVAWLRQVGPCDVVVTWLVPAFPATGPFDMLPSPIVADMMDRIEQVQARCFRQRVRSMLGAGRVRVRMEKGWDGSDAHLIQVAREERADLIVVGTHQRHGLRRIAQLSVSRGVLHYAPMSVACVPLSAGLARTGDETMFTELDGADAGGHRGVLKKSAQRL